MTGRETSAGHVGLDEALERNVQQREESDWYRQETEGRPKWTDPTTCPECGVRGNEIWLEWHLFDEHGWCLIERHFGSESLVEPRETDAGDQVTLGDLA